MRCTSRIGTSTLSVRYGSFCVRFVFSPDAGRGNKLGRLGWGECKYVTPASKEPGSARRSPSPAGRYGAGSDQTPKGGGEGMTGVADRRAERVVSAGIVGESLAQSTMLRPRTDQRTGSEPA